MIHHPDRRRFILSTGGMAGAALISDLFPAGAGQKENRPNIVMIVSDDQRWTDFGFMGHKVIQTPRLDRLAKQSALFPNGYVPCALCRASLATILTGLYAHQHAICCNDPPRGTDRTRMHPFIHRAPALPRLLRPARYASIQTGKFWEGHYGNAGFTHGETTNSDRHIARKVPQIGRRTMKPIFDFIDTHRRLPFFVWYAPMMPHYPHTPPASYLKRYRKGRDIRIARYYAMCEWFDHTCGQLLDHLDKRKLSNNTLVVFVVDNGWVQPTTAAEKGKRRSPFGGPRGKRSPYDGGVRTPVLLRWPGHTRAGRYNDLVSTIDLAPSILTATNLRVPAQMQGQNLLNVAACKGRLKRNIVYGEIYKHDCTVLGRPRMDVTFRWVREGDWKLIVPTDRKKSAELYNLARDPHENNDLAAKEKRRVGQLRKQLEQWWKKRT